MDKNTLSNYGWIVVMILCLSVLIALATPFGGYIRAGVENTVQGLFETEDAALGKVLDDMGIVPSVDELQAKHKFDYYSTFRGAVADVNANTIGVNADCDKEDATAGVYTDNGEVFVVLLKDTTEMASISINENMTINFGGHKLSISAKTGLQMMSCSNKTLTLDGSLKGSELITNSTGNNNVFAVVFFKNNVNVKNMKISSVAENGVSVGINVGPNGNVNIEKSEIQAYSSIQARAFNHEGSGAIANDSKFIGYSNYLITDDGKSYKASSGGIYSTGELTLNNCYAMGSHSGVQAKGITYINGGIYEGYGHGGFYFSGSTIYAENAISRKCNMIDGYLTDIISNGSGMYIGGGGTANNIIVNLNNCTLYGDRRPIVMRGTDGEQDNTLRMSNCNINLDYTETAVRIDNDTHKLYLGKGNNFTAEKTSRPSSVILTDEIYCQ